MSKPKKWEDYTNGELWDIYSNSFNSPLKMKIRKIFDQRGVTLADQYRGTFDRNATGRKNESDTPTT